MILHNKFWNMISSNKYFFLKTSLHVLIESFNKKLFSTAIISIFVLNLNRLKESKISYYRLHSLSQIIYILIRSLQQVIILLILKKKSGKHVIFLVSLLIMFYQLNFLLHEMLALYVHWSIKFLFVPGVYEHIHNVLSYSKDVPYFEVSTERNVSVVVGQTSHLNCTVRDLGDRTVSIIMFLFISYST